MEVGKTIWSKGRSGEGRGEGAREREKKGKGRIIVPVPDGIFRVHKSPVRTARALGH